MRQNETKAGQKRSRRTKNGWVAAVVLLLTTVTILSAAFVTGETRILAGETVRQNASADDTESASVQTSATVSAYELPSYELRELADGTISYTDGDIVTKQIACEERNGIYLLSGSELSFYSLETGGTEQVYTFAGDTDAYEEDGILYVLYKAEVYIYDLIQMELSGTMTIESGYTGRAVGVDKSGRIYVAAYATTNGSRAYKIFLYSADGTLLSSCETEKMVYSFGGFDSTNGYYYVSGAYSWTYGSVTYPSKAMKRGEVTDNVITFNETAYVMLCRTGYHSHRDGVALLGDKYVVAASGFYGKVRIWNSDANLTAVVSFDRKAVEYTYSNSIYGDIYDITSIGVRAVYNEWRDSIILYEGGKILTEYDPETEEALAQFETQHYVFNILQMGDTLLVIEKEDDVYYLEIIDWGAPEEITFDEDSKTLKVGEAEQLTVDTGTNYSLDCVWSSSDNSVASVTDTGWVAAWSEGTATITASVLDGKCTATIQIYVTASDIETPAENAVIIDGTVSDNASDNNYEVADTTVKSYLFENENGTLTRVEYIYGTGILVEIYSADYELASSQVLELELSTFGGFYAGENYNFLVFGQSNTEESDEREVVRIVKYDKSWNRISQCSIYGANTYMPFASGSARMTEADGLLYLHTCHTMYEASDGYNHQANMTFVVDESSMEVTDSCYIVINVAYGYVSHSFNQYIQTDGTYIYRVDHGDASPRAVTITKASVDGSVTDVSYTYALSIQGEKGANATGVSVGGFEISSSKLLIVGNSVDQSDADTYSASGQRNIFLSVTDQNLDDTELIWLTDYTSEDGITPRTPQLVKLDDYHFLIMWEEYSDSTGKTLVKAVTVDGDGQLTSEILTLNARLSDDQPIVTSDGLVKWYVTDGSDMTLYMFNAYDLYAAVYWNLTVENAESGVQVSYEPSSGIDHYAIYRKEGDGSYVLAKSTTDTAWLDTDVESDGTYTYQLCVYFASGKRIWTDEVSIMYLDMPELSEAYNVNGGIQLTWKEVAGASEYYVYYKKPAASTWNSKTVAAGEEEEICYTLSSVTSGTTYDIYVKAYASGDYSSASEQKRVLYLRAPYVLLAEDDDGLYINWGTVTGAEGYLVYRKNADGSWQLVQTTTGLSVTDNSVKSGETGTYQVFAYAGDAISGGSTEKTLMYLSAPKLKSVASVSGGISVTWETVEGAERYYYRFLEEDTDSYYYGYITAKDGSTQSATFGADSGYTYSIYISATADGYYSLAAGVTGHYYLSSCSVSYISNTMDGFKVAWNQVNGASGYYIYRRNDDGTYSTTPTATVTGGSTTVWTDPLVLTGGKDYTYKVAAYYKSSDGTITIGPSGTTKTCKFLKGGEVESVTNTTSGLKVTWTKVAGANGYYIFRKAAGESDYTQVATVTGSSKVSWTDTSSLTSGKNYTYKVSAIFTNSKGQVTKGGAKVTKTTKYLTAGKISSMSNTANGMYIKWTKVTGATGYYVYRKSSSASSYTLVKTITSVGTVSYTDTAVKSNNNTTYTYYIQPYFKSSAGVITKAAYNTKTFVRLVAPTISSLTNSAAKTMTVKWGTKSGVTGYQVQYSANSSFSSGNKTLTLTGASTSSKVISGLTKGKTYYVRIRTYKTVNGTTYYSAWTTKKSVKISK